MSTNPSAGSFNRPAPSGQSATNSWGLAGLVTSILGIFTCGLLHPVSLLISLVGLMKPPRGTAIAGLVISLLGTGFFALMGYGIVMTVLGVKEAVTDAHRKNQTAVTISEIKTRIENHRDMTGALPDSVEGNKLILDDKDGWDQPLRYETSADKYVIRSAGPDQKMDTPDDVTSEENLVETEVNIEGPGGDIGDGPFIIPDGANTAPPDPFSENLDLPDDLENEKFKLPEANP